MIRKYMHISRETLSEINTKKALELLELSCCNDLYRYENDLRENIKSIFGHIICFGEDLKLNEVVFSYDDVLGFKRFHDERDIIINLFEKNE